jgi:lysozyme
MSEPPTTATSILNPCSIVTRYSRRLTKPWKVSNELISFLGVWESGILNGKNFQRHDVTDGLILTAYTDDRGNPTVGMGHLIVPADRIKVGQAITLERAREFARRDLEQASSALHRQVGVPLFQFEFDALVSVAFNCGAGNGIADLVAQVNNETYEKMFDFIRYYRRGHHRTLAYRRYTEAKMFAAGVYDASH